MADEIPEAAITAVVDVLVRRWETIPAEYGVNRDVFADTAREVLAAALPHLDGEQQRVVLIKPGDRLIIGGITLPGNADDADRLKAVADTMHDLGFGAVAFIEHDASVAVEEDDAIRRRHTELRDAVSRLLGHDVALPTQVLVDQLASTKITGGGA